MRSAPLSTVGQYFALEIERSELRMQLDTVMNAIQHDGVYRIDSQQVGKHLQHFSPVFRHQNQSVHQVRAQSVILVLEVHISDDVASVTNCTHDDRN